MPRTARLTPPKLPSPSELQEASSADFLTYFPAKNAVARSFAQIFWGNVPDRDQTHAQLPMLASAAKELLAVAETAKATKITLHIDNPDDQPEITRIFIVMLDQPFIVDSVTAALQRLGYMVGLGIYPVGQVLRDKQDRISELLNLENAKSSELMLCFSFFSIERVQEKAALTELKTTLKTVLEDIRVVVTDWEAMQSRAKYALHELHQANQSVEAHPDLSEADAFIEWLLDNHFTFLGYIEYQLSQNAKGWKAKRVTASALGLLRQPHAPLGDDLLDTEDLSKHTEKYFSGNAPLFVIKTTTESPVHRPVQCDRIALRRYDATGKIVGEHVFYGLFTSLAYSRGALDTPYIRQKVGRTLSQSGLAKVHHDYKALAQILNTYPRDELFQVSEKTLNVHAHHLLALQDRELTALVVRRDAFSRYVSCLIYTPREPYHTGIRKRFEQVLQEAFGGRVTLSTSHSDESPLVRVHIRIARDSDHELLQPDLTDIEAQLAQIGQSWYARLRHALFAQYGTAEGRQFFDEYGRIFGVAYREQTTPEAAVADIQVIVDMLQDGPQVDLRFVPDAYEDGRLRLRLFHVGGPVPLAYALSTLENMGLRVLAETPLPCHFTAPVPTSTIKELWIHEFTIEALVPEQQLLDEAANVRDSFEHIWAKATGNDPLNSLVVLAQLTWAEVRVVRACARYLQQARLPYSQLYVMQTAQHYPALMQQLIEIFHILFDPKRKETLEKRRKAAQALADAYLEQVSQVKSPDEDTILRRMLNVVMAILRTNYYQLSGNSEPKPYLSLKLKSADVLGLPAPRPLYETFVYSQRVEAIHLRSSKIARGGIRWSDRREDYRDEVLGLMKAQKVKNAVIVPSGAKGGFYVKQSPIGADRQAQQAEGIACYQLFVRGLLDIADNYKGSDIIKPINVVCHDDNDPYIVVAADKGTATFSDIANGLAAEYDFWLGDAFASGGSAGYDHKKMGITARGAWECVKRHFAELGKDIQKEPFNVIGVGDMGGDVFGNGMLLSKQIRLTAAFNHTHIFCDPNPDIKASYDERLRLFKAVGNWDQYNTKLLSKGGQIFPRNLKQCQLTPEIQASLGITDAVLTPEQLMHAILKAQTELLWFGGIGTYVKAHNEVHGDVRDKANDAIRINANELHCQVIGEGANLGMTQLSRIEAAHSGVKLNTDFIDNSAGVNSSDYEVNIKIFFNEMLRNGKIKLPERNKFLETMTGEVAELVLANNRAQSLTLSISTHLAAPLIEHHARYIRELEHFGLLDRTVEFLPDDAAIAERMQQQQGLTRPEIAVLLSYAKLSLVHYIGESALPDNQAIQKVLLEQYFPAKMVDKYGKSLENHRLARNITAMMLSNHIINYTEPTFVKWLIDRTGQEHADIVQAWWYAHELFDIPAMWHQLVALTGKIRNDVQLQMFNTLIKLQEQTTAWLLANADHTQLPQLVKQSQPVLKELRENLTQWLGPKKKAALHAREAVYMEAGAPKAITQNLAQLPIIANMFDIWQIQQKLKLPLALVANTYFLIGEEMGLAWMREQTQPKAGQDYWQRQALAAIHDDILLQQAALTSQILQGANKSSNVAQAIKTWRAEYPVVAKRLSKLEQELRATPQLDVAVLAVANRRLRGYISERR